MHVPVNETRYAVAARAPVEVGPRTKGTTLAYDLTREAKELGPVRFDAFLVFVVHAQRHVITTDAYLVRVEDAPSRRDIEFPAMPGAAQDASL